jgi:Ca2+-binding EF-hand superfamily protein
MSIFLTNQEEAALMKKFDHNGDGVISMEEFYETLCACM